MNGNITGGCDPLGKTQAEAASVWAAGGGGKGMVHRNDRNDD